MKPDNRIPLDTLEKLILAGLLVILLGVLL